MVVVATILGYLYKNIAQENLIYLGESKNAALAQVFANTLWPYYSNFVHELEVLEFEDIRNHPVTQQLKRDIRTDTIGLDVVKVKIYTIKGLTIFSTDAAQIGIDKSKNPDFLTAMAGGHATELEYKEGMPAIDGTIRNRNLIASYIPILNLDTGSIDGVFELYSDVTPLYGTIQNTVYSIYGIVVLMFSLLFLALFTVVKRADTIIVENYTSLETNKKEIEQRALHDALTGLPNRLLLQDRLDHAMRRATREETLIAVLFIDLDRFKPINDSLGHAVGDTLLVQVAKRLTTAVRDSDTVSRIGGDEFVVILENILHVDQANVVAERILDALARPMVIKGKTLFVTSSIGITFYPFEDGDISIDEVIKNADAAMYAVKKGGRNMYQVFSHRMRSVADAKAEVEQKLHLALPNKEFVLHYQPILETRSGKVDALECLIRWESPQLGLVSPLQFISTLEESGVIVEVGKWVIQEACATIRRLERMGCDDIRVNVNISPKQFMQAEFVESVHSILLQSGVSGKKLVFEMTESLLVNDISQVVQSLLKLREFGISVAIDDFGVGYSSLNYLKRIPVETLKIDKTFISELSSCAEDVAILEAIATLSKSLQLKTVAEGVETEEQYRFILRKEIDFVQGFLLCRPYPFNELMEKLTINRSGIWLSSRIGKSGTN